MPCILSNHRAFMLACICMCICVCVCVCTFVCTCMCVCVYMHTNKKAVYTRNSSKRMRFTHPLPACMFVYVSICTCIFVCVYICMCVYMSVYVCMIVFMHKTKEWVCTHSHSSHPRRLAHTATTHCNNTLQQHPATTHCNSTPPYIGCMYACVPQHMLTRIHCNTLQHM